MDREGEMKKEDILRKLEAVKELATRGATPGERAAARNKVLLLTHQLNKIDPKLQLPERTFRIHDPWSRQLLTTLFRRHGIISYQRKGQHEATIMARMDRAFYNDVFWSQFCDLVAVLNSRLEKATKDFIAEAIPKKEPTRTQRP
jgi:hypothetical protein